MEFQSLPRCEFLAADDINESDLRNSLPQFMLICGEHVEAVMVATAVREPRDEDGRRDCCHEGEKLEAQKNCAQAKTADGTQQPAKIEPGGTQLPRAVHRLRCS